METGKYFIGEFWTVLWFFCGKKSDFDVHVHYFNMHHTFINSLIKSIFFWKKIMLLLNLNFFNYQFYRHQQDWWIETSHLNEVELKFLRKFDKLKLHFLIKDKQSSVEWKQLGGNELNN